MKKIFVILFISLFFVRIACAANAEGYYISKSGDTVKVTFIVSTFAFTGGVACEPMQEKIKYYDSNDKKQTLEPSMAKEVCFNFKKENIRMLSVENSFRFLRLIKDGKLRLFLEYYTVDNGQGRSIVKRYHLQKNNGYLFRPGDFSFKKDMVAYFADCPELAQKIEDKILKKHDMEEIVDEYNELMKNKK